MNKHQDRLGQKHLSKNGEGIIPVSVSSNENKHFINYQITAFHLFFG